MLKTYSGALRPPPHISFVIRSCWSWGVLMRMHHQVCKQTWKFHNICLQVNPSNQLKRKAEEGMHAGKAEKVAKIEAARGASPQSQTAAGPTAKGSAAAADGSMRR